MSTPSTLQVSEAAGRYASALLDLASEKNALEQTERELTGFAEAISTVPELNRVLTSPTMKAEDKLGAVSAVAAKMGLSSLVANFLGTVTQNRRANELPAMIHAFKEAAAEKRGVTRASVISAHELSKAQVKELQDLVASVAGGEVSMDVQLDPSLIAGFQLKIGSRLIDASVKTKLDRMNLAMKGA